MHEEGKISLVFLRFQYFTYMIALTDSSPLRPRLGALLDLSLFLMRFLILSAGSQAFNLANYNARLAACSWLKRQFR